MSSRAAAKAALLDVAPTVSAGSSISRRPGQPSAPNIASSSSNAEKDISPQAHEIRELREALSKLQIEYGKLSERLQKSEQENAELRLLVSKKMKSLPAGAITNVGSVSSADANLCTKFGRRMPVFYTPDITIETFGIPKPKFDFLSPARYDDENILLGPVSDLYECITPNQHDRILHDRGFAKLFIDSASSQISNSLLRIRSKAGDIFGVPQTLFEAQVEIDRSENATLAALSGAYRDADGKVCYPEFPPVLYPSNAVGDATQILLGEHLITIAIMVIYGTSFLRSEKTPTYKSNNTFIAPWPKDEISDRFHATPGFLAFIAMATCFMLSNDTEFSNTGIGNVTGVNYYYMHGDLTEGLIFGLAEKKPCIQATFDTYNERVFPRSARGIAAAHRRGKTPMTALSASADKRSSRLPNQPRMGMRAMLAKMPDTDPNAAADADQSSEEFITIPDDREDSDSDAQVRGRLNATASDSEEDHDKRAPPPRALPPRAPLPHAPKEKAPSPPPVSAASNRVRRHIPVALAHPATSDSDEDKRAPLPRAPPPCTPPLHAPVERAPSPPPASSASNGVRHRIPVASARLATSDSEENKRAPPPRALPPRAPLLHAPGPEEKAPSPPPASTASNGVRRRIPVASARPAISHVPAVEETGGPSAEVAADVNDAIQGKAAQALKPRPQPIQKRVSPRNKPPADADLPAAPDTEAPTNTAPDPIANTKKGKKGASRKAAHD